MNGQRLLDILIEATGLPPEELQKELNSLLEARGVSVEALTLEDVREVLASYLQDVLVDAKEASRQL